MHTMPTTTTNIAASQPVAEPGVADRTKRAGIDWLAYVAIARPDHWFKNVFMLVGVLLALFCHVEFWQASSIVTLAIGFIATCIVASSNYVLNEVLDAPLDRHHPIKRHRPIPSGRVLVPLAYVEWLILGIVGLLLASTINWPFFASAAALLFMGLVYNVPPIRTKQLPYLDVLSESVNNPLRLMLGWFAVTSQAIPPLSLMISYWLVGAFFMASKRFAEYRSIGDKAVAAAYRSSFHYYDENRLLVSMCSYACGSAFLLGVFIIRYHLELILLVPLVAGFFGYYLHIALKVDSPVQAPEKLYREWGLMIYLAVCLVAFVLLMFVEIPWLYELFNVPPSQVPALWKI
ncbi:MAG: UbiA prenyltransferase family protein [Pirellulales bacterium]